MEQIDGLLDSLKQLKPPGASKGKITSITTICVENVKYDIIIAQKLFTHFKKTHSTHKLGILFLVDSITRQWIEKARNAGQELAGSSSPDGTYASGVFKMTELMPSLIDELLRVAPEDQKVKVSNLVDIWERGNTFPPKMLADFKQKLRGQPSHIVSSTPPGSPPPAMLSHLGLMNGSQNARPQQPAATSQPDAASILAALAGMNNNNNSKPAVLPPPPPPPQAPAPTQDLSALLANISRQAPPPAATPQNFALPPAPPQFGGAFPPPQPNQLSLPPQLQGMFPPPPQQAPPPQFQPPPPAANPIAALSSLLPPHILGNPQALTQVLTLFQDLAKAGIPQEQWGPVITALYPAQPAPTAAPAWQPPQQNENGNRNGGFDSFGAYNNQGGRRDRSRSPDFGHNRNVPGRRPSPVYGTYDAAAASGADGYQDDGGRGRGKGGRQYRQRTPPRNGGLDNLIPGSIAPKWTDIDPTIAPGSIKVLSRTLFVGGATGTESEIRAIFSRFGRVQTCIVNNDKRHAFVKMATRQDAVNARAGMENQRDPDILSKARQTKWGVGFGPRECCDYTTGVSIIPIDSLTEADHKWVLTAEYGGTGGRPVESGLVMEEPDIEIGAGVSSKAMSRRVMPDTSGGKRGRGGRGGDHGGGGGRFRQPEPRYESPRPETQSVQPPPPVPNFGFQFAMPGMPPYQ